VIWRPLLNPYLAGRGVTSSLFSVVNPRGFGLMQRDRAFSSYEDLETRAELRPSAWVEPIGDWGPGQVELVLLPTDNEFQDNVVAYWRPEAAPQPGRPIEVRYRLHWQMAHETRPPSSWVTQTRRGRGAATPARGEDKFVVDFSGPALASLPADAKVDAEVTASANAKVLEQVVYRNEANGSWRLSLRVQRVDSGAGRAETAMLPPASSFQFTPIELRAFLRHQTHTVSETWSYLHPTQPTP
jgi:glucans biosynthesis protein